MLKTLTAGLAAIALCCAPGPARGQGAGGPHEGGTVTGPELAKRREALIAQCSPIPSISDADAAKLPINVTRWGTKGPRVVLIHGGVQGRLGGGPATFLSQQAWGGDGWRVELADRPGFGQSPSRGPDDMERDAVWIADMLGDDAHLVGHSWGGAEALLAAALRPEAVRSLVLVEPALAAIAEADPSLRDSPAVKAGAVMRARMLMAAQTPAEYGMMFAKMLGTAADNADEATASASLGADPAEAAAMGCALLQARMAPFDELQRAIETVMRAGVPVLIVTGGWNQGFDAAAEVLAKLTHGRHVVVRSPNHFVQLANAPDFNQEVGAFMREADRTRKTPQAAGQ